MTNKNDSFCFQTIPEIGTPIDLFGNEADPQHSGRRVMPSQFSFPTMPMGCTFIRNIGSDRYNEFKS